MRPYIAKRGWTQRLYPLWEAIVFIGGIALIIGVAFFASWSGE